MVNAGISNVTIKSVDSGSKVSESRKSKSSETDFTKVLEKQTDMSASVKNNDEKSCKLAENVEMKEIIQKHFGSKDNEAVTIVDETEENIEEMAATVFVNMVNVIADNLNVEPEKVMETIESLGYEAGDVLNTDVINDVVKELTGMESIMDILVDKELSGAIKNIYMEIGEIEEVFEKDFGISREQLSDMLDNIDITPATGVVTDDVVIEDKAFDYANDAKSDTKETVNNIIHSNSDNSADNDVTEIKDSNVDTDYGKVKLENYAQDDSHTTDSNSQEDSSKTIVNEILSRKTTSNESSTHETSGNEGFNILNEIRKTVVDRIVGEDNGLADRIVKQITDDIRMYARQDTTSLEIQLEPEALGKVSLTVASKSGTITAQLVVQNEVAKEAVESQVATLKETMNNQGIKIEAIEVTLASKEFEENLDKHNDTSEHHEQNNKKHLTNEELAEINGINVSNEDIKEEIMKEMGNTVSYIA